MKIFHVFTLFLVFSTSCEAQNTAKQSNENKENIVQRNTVAAQENSTRINENKINQDNCGQKKSGNFDIAWTKENILVTDLTNGNEVFSARKFALKRLKKNYSENFGKDNEPLFADFTFGYKVISTFGSFLFLKESTSYSPQTYTKEIFVAVDLNKPDAVVSLERFAEQDEILMVLLKNTEIAADLRERNILSPKTLNDFFALFNKNSTQAREVSERLFEKCWFPANILESFAVDKIESDVEISLGIFCKAGMRDEEVYPLKLLLPLNKNMQTFYAEDIQKKEWKNEETFITFDEKSLRKKK